MTAGGKAHGSQALQNAISVLISKAIYDGAEHDGAIFLDLANHGWQAVKRKYNQMKVDQKKVFRRRPPH